MVVIFRFSMKSIACSIAIWLLANFPIVLKAQLEGCVCDEEGSPIEAVIVKVYADEHSTIDAYTKTDKKGNFLITKIPTFSQTLRVSFSRMGYEDYQQMICKIPFRMDVKMKAGHQKIKEVTIKAIPVRKYGDTLSYNVMALQNPTDQTIEDIIKRIPGITVENNGGIKYNGEPINRFYIEGINLLDNRYMLATQNLRPEDISMVDVYENHQPIKVLQNLKHSEQAALNLRLRKNRLSKPFGEIKAGLGGYEDLLGETDQFAMSFNKKNQLLGTLEANNTGRSLQDEADQQIQEKGISENIMNENSFGIPNLLPERFHRNRSLKTSLSHAYSPQKNHSLNFNLEYAVGSTYFDQEHLEEYFNPHQEYIQFNDRFRTDIAKQNLALKIKWEINTYQNYLLNQFNIYGSIGNEHYIFKDRKTQQDNEKKKYHIHHQLRWVKKNKHSYYDIHSTLNFSHHPVGTMTAFLFQDQGTPSDTFLMQNVEGYRFNSQQNTSFHFRLGERGGHLGVFLRMQHDVEMMKSDFHRTPPTNGPTFNDNHGYRLQIQVGPNYQWNTEKISINIPLPLHIVYQNYRYHGITHPYRKYQVHWEPATSFTFRANGNLRFIMRCGYQENEGNFSDFVMQPVYFNYRQTTTMGNGEVSKNKSWYVRSEFFWRDVPSARNLTIKAGYQRYGRNGLSSTIVNDSCIEKSVLHLHHDTHVWNANFDLSKNFFSIQTFCSLKGDFNSTQSGSMRQQQMVKSINRYYQLTAYAQSLVFDRHVSLGMAYKWSLSTQSNQFSPTQKRHQMGGNFILSILPNQQWEIYTKGEINSLQIDKKRFTTWFQMDGGVRYIQKKWELHLKGTNLTNCQEFVQDKYTLTDHYRYICRLRPIELVLSAKFKF